MTAKQRDRDIKHWENVAKTCKDRQQVFYAEHRIEQIREEWRKSKLLQCNGNCRPSAMSYDCNCPIHGWI